MQVLRDLSFSLKEPSTNKGRQGWMMPADVDVSLYGLLLGRENSHQFGRDVPKRRLCTIVYEIGWFLDMSNFKGLYYVTISRKETSRARALAKKIY